MANVNLTIKNVATKAAFDALIDVATGKWQTGLTLVNLGDIINGLPGTGAISYDTTGKKITIAGFGTFEITGTPTSTAVPANSVDLNFVPDSAALAPSDTITVTSLTGAQTTGKWLAVGSSTLNKGVKITGTTTTTDLIGGTGADTISGAGTAAGEKLTGNSSADVFTTATNGAADLIQDYNYSEGDVIETAFSATGSITFASQKVKVTDAAAGSTDTLETQVLTPVNNITKVLVKSTAGVAGYYAANEVTELWFGADAGSVMDASAVTKAINLKGGASSDVISGNDKANNITDGAGVDAIWGGKGNDTIELATDNAGDTVWFSSGDGSDSVSGFTRGFGATADAIKVWGKTNIMDYVAFSGDGTNAKIAVASSDTISLSGAANTAAGVQLKLKDANDKITKAWMVDSGVAANFAVNSSTGAVADIYVGTVAQTADLVDYSSEAAGVSAWLGNTSQFKSVEKLTGGTGDDTLSGGDAANTISGGNGNDQLWGGSSASDTLIGGANNNVFWFGAGDGQDSINDFYLASTSNKIKLHDRVYDKVVSGTTVSKDATNIKITIGSDVLSIAAASGSKAVTLVDKNNKSVIIAATDTNNIDYGSTTKLYYGATGLDTTLKIGTSITSANVYLGNGYDGIVTNDIYFANVTNIDATSSTGENILCGNSASNVIQAGSGNTGMWGGGDKADTMVGGAGVDSFWFGTKDGKDVVQGASNLDKVVLYSDAITNLTGTIDGSNLVITTKAGDTLTISNWATTAADSQMNTFQVGTDSSAKNYKFDVTTKTFIAK